jgi:NAD(P)-dependent dehydrogenase (short-subunit alcohol dehydrogenase family)
MVGRGKDNEMDEKRDPTTEHPVAVITGGSQGLGRALATALADRGWHLVIDARRADRLDNAVADLRGHTRVRGIAGDVTDAGHRQDLAAAAAELGGPVRLLVNNASTLGASPLPSLDSVRPEVLERAWAVNVAAPVSLTATLLPALGAGGTVINITSDAAVEAYEGWGVYGATKAALEHVSRVLAAEHPELRVLAVDPGDLRTEMHQDAFPGEDISDRPAPDEAVPGLMALVEGDQPSGRYAVADVVVPVVS